MLHETSSHTASLGQQAPGPPCPLAPSLFAARAGHRRAGPRGRARLPGGHRGGGLGAAGGRVCVILLCCEAAHWTEACPARSLLTPPLLPNTQAAVTAGTRLPICAFPLPCVYVAPVIVSWTCGVTVPVAIQRVGGVGWGGEWGPWEAGGARLLLLLLPHLGLPSSASQPLTHPTSTPPPQCNVAPKPIIICGKAGLPVKPEQVGGRGW